MNSTIESLNSKIAEPQYTVEAKEREIEALNGKINELTLSIDILNNKISELQSTVGAKEKEIESLNGKINQLKSAI